MANEMEWKSLYCNKPWLNSYPKGVLGEIEVPKKTVIEAFDEAVEKWKEKTCLIFYGKKITYQDLKEKVNRFANALSHLGIKKGDRVALLLLNSPEFIVAFYGAIKIGAIVTSLSPVYVSGEIKHQLVDSGADTIICQNILYEKIEKTGLKFKNIILTNITESLPLFKKIVAKKVLRSVYERLSEMPSVIAKERDILQMKDLIKRYPPDPPKIETSPDDPVILQYTGGTTGRPKGATITHHNMIAGNVIFDAFYPLNKGKEVVIAYMPFYHQGGVTLILVEAIWRGDTIVVLSAPDMDKILHYMCLYGATYFIGTPSLYERLKDDEKAKRVDWKKLEVVFSGADVLNMSTAKDWEDRTGVRLHDFWGMTELVCFSIGNPIGRSKLGSIGIPLPNIMAAILDPDENKFAKVGEVGEIVIAGTTVIKGYWNNPQATKDCEVTIEGIRWWRTGDLARMDEDGYFYLYDRKRDMIKYKGLRIFAREVEEVLKEHPKIKEVCVIGVKDIKVGEVVKAFVVPESDATRESLSEADIIEYCRDKLAPYKIPKMVEFVGEIPKTNIGKVSRRELREING